MKEKKRFSFFAAPPDEARRGKIYAHLLNKHPGLQTGEIGTSLLARPIPYIRIGGGRRAILYVGTHHAMEWITSLLLYRFADDFALATRRRGSSLSAPLPGDRSLFIVPMLNPDGVEIQQHGAAAGGLLSARLLRQNGGDPDFSHWQANARGVDLNHNYDAGFDAYRAVERDMGIFSGGPTRYSGEYPFSEPETDAIARFAARLRPVLTLTLHTQGEEIFFYPTRPPITGAQEMGLLLSRLTGYRLGQADGAAAYGGMSDYLAERLRLPSYTLECGLGQNPLPINQAQSIYLRLRRALFLAVAFSPDGGCEINNEREICHDGKSHK